MYWRCVHLVSIPAGNQITEKKVATWLLELQGRSTYPIANKHNATVKRGLLENRKSVYSTTENRKVGIDYGITMNKEGEADYKSIISTFTSLSAFMIRSRGAQTLRKAKAAHSENVKYYKKALQERFLIPKSSDLKTCTASDCFYGITGKERDQIIDSTCSIYNDSLMIKIRFLERDIKRSYLEPSLSGLLRPQLSDLPRRLDLEPRDAFISRIKMRAEHLSTIVDVLRVDKTYLDERVLELIAPLSGTTNVGPGKLVSPPDKGG